MARYTSLTALCDKHSQMRANPEMLCKAVFKDWYDTVFTTDKKMVAELVITTVTVWYKQKYRLDVHEIGTYEFLEKLLVQND